MNLFATDPCPVACAQALDNLRVINQCRETGQMLSTGLLLLGAANGVPVSAPYKLAHAHHPVTRWVVSSEDAYLWTLDHMEALAGEHRHRYPSSPWHRTFELHRHIVQACKPFLRAIPASFQNSARNADVGVDFTGIADVHHAYRAYLTARWRIATAANHPPSWGSRGAPWWLSTDGRQP